MLTQRGYQPATVSPPVGIRSLDVKMQVAEAEMTWGEKKMISTNARGCYVRGPAIEFRGRLLVLRLSTV